MKNISTALQTYLNSFVNYTSDQFLMAEFYSITLSNGTTISYSSADVSLTYSIPGQTVSGGTVYNPLGGMRVERGKMRTVAGTQVDQMDVILYPSSNDKIQGNGVPYEILSGGLDGAWVSIDRAFLTSWTSAGIVGTVNVFAGRISDCQIGRTSVTMTLKSPLELLNLNFPRNTFQPGCLHNLFDSGCGLNQASFEYTGAVSNNAASNASTIAMGIFQSPGFFVQGYISFTSGVLAGLTRSIVAYNNLGNGQAAVVWPFPQAPSVGDTFIAFPGCDHTTGTCLNTFANIINFRGFPNVPSPETAA